MRKEPFTLYGLAVAAIPAAGNPNVLNFTCTPISISDAHPEKFDIVKDLCPNGGKPIALDVTDTKNLTDGLVTIVDLLGKVVALQKESCRKEKIPCQPIVLDVGEDGDRPPNVNAFYMHLFNERVSPALTRDDFVRTYKDFLDKESNYEFRKPFDSLRDEEKNSLFNSGIVKSVLDEQAEMEAGVVKAVAARNAFLEQHKTLPLACRQAFKKLSGLLGECSLRLDSYQQPQQFFYNYNQTPLDIDLVRLKPAFDAGNKDAFEEIRRLAYEEGKVQGDKENTNYKDFKRFPPPRYDEEMRKKLPRFCYYQWDKAFEQAYHKGFQEAFLGPHTMHMKLPFDQKNPLFSDPVFYRLQDQMQVVNHIKAERGDVGHYLLSRRSPDGIIDDEKWRKMTLAFSKRAAGLE